MPRILPEVLRNLFRKPATVKYPRVRVIPPEGYRGKPLIEREKCIQCWLCIRACPAKAITASPETKAPRIDLARCVFCGECADACPRKAIAMSLEFELAAYDKKQAVSE